MSETKNAILALLLIACVMDGKIEVKKERGGETGRYGLKKS